MRRTVVLGGIAAVAVYLGGAFVSGHMNPLNRRPLLEGAGPPPAYSWVNPPPDLAKNNKKPVDTSRAITLDARGSVAGVFSTHDYQMSVVLRGQGIETTPGTKSATITIDPLDPAQFPPLPKPLVGTGNVYRVRVFLEPSKTEITDFRNAGQAQMFYPSPPPSQLLADHVVAHSVDGKTWKELPTNDQPVQQQALAQTVNKTGYFTVGVRPAAKKAKPKGSPLMIVLIVAGAALVGGGTMAVSRQRREIARRKAIKARQIRRTGKRR